MSFIIGLANELGKVMTAKEIYLQEVESYKEKARACGVTEETLNYILHDPQVTTVRDAYE